MIIVLVVAILIKPKPRPASGAERPQLVSEAGGTGQEERRHALITNLPVRDHIYRDFFASDHPIRKTSGQQHQASRDRQDRPVLKAILIGSKRRAWINDFLVSEGQIFSLNHDAKTVDLWEVKRIETDRVYLRRGTEDMVLTMPTEEGPENGAVGRSQ